MGFDTSYHPVDVKLIHQRVVPYILGATGDDSLDDLIDEAVRIRRIRWRAKAWALGTSRALTDVDGFNPFLHVWGRPLFITSSRPEKVAQDVVRYLRMAGPKEVDPLARDMVAVLAPGRTVTPADPTDYPGGVDDIRAEVSVGVRLLRTAVAGLRSGAERVSGLRNVITPADYLVARLPLDFVEFASILVPGWMDRGTVWPTALASAAGLSPAGFGDAGPLIEPLREALPDLKWRLHGTIVENEMAGGFVAAGQVPQAREWLLEHREQLIAATEEVEYVSHSLEKIDEAMMLAARLGHAFCEATEIYSGIGGTMN
jgi:hypothetical protein